jgi:hypothetical protein
MDLALLPTQLESLLGLWLALVSLGLGLLCAGEKVLLRV